MRDVFNIEYESLTAVIVDVDSQMVRIRYIGSYNNTRIDGQEKLIGLEHFLQVPRKGELVSVSFGRIHKTGDKMTLSQSLQTEPGVLSVFLVCEETNTK